MIERDGSAARAGTEAPPAAEVAIAANDWALTALAAALLLVPVLPRILLIFPLWLARRVRQNSAALNRLSKRFPSGRPSRLRSHNPEVAGSNPAPATSENPW